MSRLTPLLLTLLSAAVDVSAGGCSPSPITCTTPGQVVYECTMEVYAPGTWTKAGPKPGATCSGAPLTRYACAASVAEANKVLDVAIQALFNAARAQGRLVGYGVYGGCQSTGQRSYTPPVGQPNDFHPEGSGGSFGVGVGVGGSVGYPTTGSGLGQGVPADQFSSAASGWTELPGSCVDPGDLSGTGGGSGGSTGLGGGSGQGGAPAGSGVGGSSDTGTGADPTTTAGAGAGEGRLPPRGR